MNRLVLLALFITLAARAADKPATAGKPNIIFILADDYDKAVMNEGGSRVPLIANCSGFVPAGKVCADLVDFSDFYATFAELAGAKLPEGVTLDSHSFAPQLRGEKGTPREWVYVQFDADRYVRDARWKLTGDGKLFDMADAPFTEKPATDEAARNRLQAVLDKLNPAPAPPGKKQAKTY